MIPLSLQVNWYNTKYSNENVWCYFPIIQIQIQKQRYDSHTIPLIKVRALCLPVTIKFCRYKYIPDQILPAAPYLKNKNLREEAKYTVWNGIFLTLHRLPRISSHRKIIIRSEEVNWAKLTPNHGKHDFDYVE